MNSNERLGYEHATSGNGMACPTRIANADYRRGFLKGWKERNGQEPTT